MTIDTKRLETDAAYWDEVDDTKGKATHYCTQGGGFCTPDYIRHCDIPRPTKPAAPEWDGEGLPPVGCECEYRPDPENRPDWWEKCRYLAHCNEEYFVLMNHNIGVDRMNDSVPAEIRFRPVITKEKRDRGELLEILYMYEPVEVIADTILSRYNLEPKQ